MVMKVKDSFKTRKAAVAYLEARDWQVSTIFSATGSMILCNHYTNTLRGVQLRNGRWHIVRDQITLKSW
jgi:hypothetical protein